jgi:rhodanese-related sulfurtransferase
MRKTLITILAALAATAAAAADIVTSVDPATLPKGKQTPLGLYLTPADAAAALAADPGIVFIDVRDPIEVSFVGHPEPADANVPVATFTHVFDPKKGDYAPKPNPAFAQQVDALMTRLGKTRSDPVFVMCRSGGRSAKAAEALAKAGYTNVWSLVEGFEGDMDKATGRRTVNGWKNAGLPWTYALDAATAYSAAP